MALGFTEAPQGEILARCQYDARAGRLFVVNRTQDAGGSWTNDKIDITSQNPTFVLDLGSIEIGWQAFLPTGPDFHMVPLGHPFPARPSDDHKQGFRVKLFSPKFLNGLREFSSSAGVVRGAIDELHSQFAGDPMKGIQPAPEAIEGKVPVVQMTGSVGVVSKGKAGTSTNYAPTFKIISWVARPDELGERTVPAPSGKVAAPAAAPKPTAHVAPPAAKPAAKEPAFADDSEMPF
jgi:hypothetical protein